MMEKSWKTITLGIYKIYWHYLDAFEKNGFLMKGFSESTCRRMSLSDKEIIITLVRKTVAGLGLSDGATLKQIQTAAKQLGLNLCPAEVGPALRLSYPDQPEGERLLIAMWPIDIQSAYSVTASEMLEIFEISNTKGDRALYSYPAGKHRGNEKNWRANDEFVFALPK